MFDLVPGMELTPTNPMTLKPHALKSPSQVGKFTAYSFQFTVFAVVFWIQGTLSYITCTFNFQTGWHLCHKLKISSKYLNRGIWFNSSLVMLSKLKIAEKWHKEIQLEFREKPLNPAVISTFFQVFLLYNAKN